MKDPLWRVVLAFTCRKTTSSKPKPRPTSIIGRFCFLCLPFIHPLKQTKDGMGLDGNRRGMEVEMETD